MKPETFGSITLYNADCMDVMRVLEPYGILIFKWNEFQIPVSKILKVFGTEPLFGQKSGKTSQTHWMCFIKMESNKNK